VKLKTLCIFLFASTTMAQVSVRESYYFRHFGVNEDNDERTGFENENRALPAAAVGPKEQQAAYQSFLSISKRPGGKKGNWQELGPITAAVPGPSTYTGRPSLVSGRVTALALSPGCHANDCKIFVGAAGGGVWEADDALAQRPNWAPSGKGIPSNAIGSLIFDPTDSRGLTLYAGTGEPSGSGDSEAGVGLYKSVDFGKSWSLVPGSLAVSEGRSIGAIAVDSGNASHILIGTAVARHGSASVNGGRFTPPGTPVIGLYESWDGGATFSLAFSRPADPVNPAVPTNGGDFFRGGITKIRADRTGLSAAAPTRFYFSVFGYGLYRSTGPGLFEQVFASAGGGTVASSASSRTEFALAPHGTALRIYLGDAGTGAANFYRVDDANVSAASLTNGGTNAGWLKLSNPTKGTSGFGSYNFCGQQCSYDMVVESPAGRPDTVWIGGQMQYSEIFTSQPPSNGRAVQRSADAGVHFTDMTNDTLEPPTGLHPDQHAIVFAAANPDIAIMGSDGGVVRTSGSFADASAGCATRGLAGADLADCQMWLRAIPTLLVNMNDGLATMQFQSLSVNPSDPAGDLQGGTQDNGTWNYSGKGKGSWFESVGGDGGQSGYNAAAPNIRMHSYTGAQHDVNFNSDDPLGWNWISDPLLASGEASSFYVPLIADPLVGGTWFVGQQRVWRTNDNGGSQAYLEQHCNEFFGDFTVQCGDWVPLGNASGNLVGAAYGTSKGGSYVVALARTNTDSHTLWAATRLGRLFISKNADAAAAGTVSFTRIDTAAQPIRFVTGIAVDPGNSNHAYVTFSGYNAYTPTTPGHVFEVIYNPLSATATWNDLSGNIGDQPVTGIAFDDLTGDIFVSTDFGVALLQPGSNSWVPAAGSLPPVAVYGLSIDRASHILYAASHGRGAWKLDLSK
jgi:hypothetical protein